MTVFPKQEQGTPGTLTFEELLMQQPRAAAALERWAKKFLENPGEWDDELLEELTPEGLRKHWTFEIKAGGIIEGNPNAIIEDQLPIFYLPTKDVWLDENDPEIVEVNTVLFPDSGEGATDLPQIENYRIGEKVWWQDTCVTVKGPMFEKLGLDYYEVELPDGKRRKILAAVLNREK